ncbi:MAG: inositol monophosphatase [Rhodospirillales bacterium 69-11]|nr:inositol monophosphatase [Rhodospirillales bacterium]OJW28665.1 MAG: inositol monophosphatase [Rhodospirillales bacterium 69-11]
MSAALDTRFDTACRLATEAAAIALRLRPPPGAAQATLKGPQDWLTEADGAVERFLSDALAAAFPADGFHGEEGGPARPGRLRWVVDPIDGTANFARGRDRFCISLGLMEDRTPLLGVIVAPALGETFTARQGGGAFLNGTPLRAATTRDPAQAIVEVGWSRRRPNDAFLAVTRHFLDLGCAVRHGGSGTLGLADVAAGRSDAYAELHINIWDSAAALVLLAEAGAALSGFLDGDGAWTGNPMLACAPALAGPFGAPPGIPAARSA